MEELQALLKEYVCQNIENYGFEWAIAYANEPFPLYWRKVYEIASMLPTNLKIVEIGAGFGFITSIFLHLGFYDITSYERDRQVCIAGNKMLYSLFSEQNVLIGECFETQSVHSDVLVLVNCVYSDGCQNKNDYVLKLQSYYLNAGQPKYFILEVIDSSFKGNDNTFPDFVRLSSDDIKAMFPTASIKSWETYRYPANRKSKKLYLIEQLP